VFDTNTMPQRLKIINLDTGVVRQVSKNGKRPGWRRESC
jgi:hypothetical protein